LLLLWWWLLLLLWLLLLPLFRLRCGLLKLLLLCRALLLPLLLLPLFRLRGGLWNLLLLPLVPLHGLLRRQRWVQRLLLLLGVLGLLLLGVLRTRITELYSHTGAAAAATLWGWKLPTW
jgi:hypothetical protein